MISKSFTFELCEVDYRFFRNVEQQFNSLFLLIIKEKLPIEWIKLTKRARKIK